MQISGDLNDLEKALPEINSKINLCLSTDFPDPVETRIGQFAWKIAKPLHVHVVLLYGVCFSESGYWQDLSFDDYENHRQVAKNN